MNKTKDQYSQIVRMIMTTKMIIILTLAVSLFSMIQSGRAQGQAKANVSSDLKKASYYNSQGQYHLSLYYLMQYLGKDPGQYEKYKGILEKVAGKTGTAPLYSYNVGFLEKFPVPTISLHLAHYYFKRKNYTKAYSYLKNIPKNNSFFPEALLLSGSIRYLAKDEQYKVYFKQCISEGRKYLSLTEGTSFKRYFILIKEQCQMNLARALYEEGKYKESIESFDMVDKRSYSWPYALREVAWSHYKLGDYNRSLGLLMTYNSPLLNSYFSPESEVLSALSYYQLCLYNDANHLVNKYYRVYKPKAEELKKFIQSASQSDYFGLVMGDYQSNNEYLKRLRAQLSKKLRLNLHMQAYQRLNDDFEKLESKKIKHSSKELKILNKMKNDLSKLVALFVKEHIYHFLNQINFFSFEMFNLKLDIITRKKDLLYADEKLVADRARGTYKNAQISNDLFFFKFDGQFWADELGDYSFGLQSNCKTVKKSQE